MQLNKNWVVRVPKQYSRNQQNQEVDVHHVLMRELMYIYNIQFIQLNKCNKHQDFTDDMEVKVPSKHLKFPALQSIQEITAWYGLP